MASPLQEYADKVSDNPHNNKLIHIHPKPGAPKGTRFGSLAYLICFVCGLQTLQPCLWGNGIHDPPNYVQQTASYLWYWKPAVAVGVFDRVDKEATWPGESEGCLCHCDGGGAENWGSRTHQALSEKPCTGLLWGSNWCSDDILWLFIRAELWHETNF